MKTRTSLLFAIAALSFASWSHLAVAQGQGSGVSARQAFDMVARQFGPQAVEWVAEIRGTLGVPQPAEWQITAFDSRMPGLLYNFRAGLRGVGDMGADQQRYPVNVPVGYFNPTRIGVDSVAAFTIAEGEARKAKMAFDSCDYLLRVREFSTDPLWRLELLNARQQIVGKIYISATSGTVLRTIWMYEEGVGRVRIVDSLSPTSRSLTTGITGTDFPAREPAPGETTGIVRMPPSTGAPSGDTGIASIPDPPAPGTVQPAFPPNNAPSTGVQPYRPVAPDGSVTGGIPEPPPTAPSTSNSATIPAPPVAGGNSTGSMRDLRDDPAATKKPDPTRPPIDIPESSGGSSERIPPPPIPPGS